MRVKHNHNKRLVDNNGKQEKRAEQAETESTHVSPVESDVEKRLRESEERYRSLVEATSQIVWTTDAEGFTGGDLHAWRSYTGQSEDEVQGTGILNAIHPDDRKRVEQQWREAVKQKRLYEAEYRLRRADGVYRLFRVRAVPVLNNDGFVREWVGVCSDITERRQLREHLQESEKRFRLMFEQANVGMAFARIDGTLFQVNQRYCDILGYARDELLSQSYRDITHPDDIAINQGYLQRLLEGEKLTDPLEKRYIRKDGSVVWTTLTLSLMRDATDTPLYYMAVIEDISARKTAEQERLRLLQREQEARTYAETTNAKLTVLQAITDTTLAHLSLENLLSELLTRIGDILHADAVAVLLPDEDGQYLKIRAAKGLEQDIIHAVAVPMYTEQTGRAAFRREPIIVDDLSQISIISKLLREKIRSLVAAPLLIEGRVIGLISVGTSHAHHFAQEDGLLLQRVADRIALAIDHIRLYEAEQQARADAFARAQQLEAIIEAMTDAITVYDKQGNILFANHAAQHILPLHQHPDYYHEPAEERISRYISRDEYGIPLTHDQLPLTRLLRGEVLAGKKSVDVIFSTADGREAQYNISGSPIRDADGTIRGAVGIAQDVTERRRLERRTQEALNGLLAMAESLVDIPEQSDDIGTIGKRLAQLTCSVLDCQRVGIQTIEPHTELVRPLAVVGLAPEQEQAWWEEQRQQATSLQDSPQPEMVARLRANEVLVVDLTQPPFNAAPNPYHITVMLVAPMCVSDQLVGLLTLDYNGEDHLFTEKEIALASAVAKLSGLVIERQRLLSERAEAQGRELALREANRRMEEFLGIASHELRTPLTTIKANVQLAMRRLKALAQQSSTLPDDANVKVNTTRDMLVRAERQVGVLNRLVGDLIDISRIQTGKLQLHLRQEPCDLAQIVRETVEEQRKAFPGRTITLTSSSDEVLPVIADPDRIAQVITNYLNNALKY